MILLEFTRDMLPSEGGFRKGQRQALDEAHERVRQFIRDGDAIVRDDDRFPSGEFRGLPPSIPERKKYLTRKS